MYLHPRNNQKLYDPHFTSVLSVLLSQSPVAAYVVHELSLEEEQESKLVQVDPPIIAFISFGLRVNPILGISINLIFFISIMFVF